MRMVGMNIWSKVAAFTLVGLLVATGCTEQPVDVRSDKDIAEGVDPDVMFDDILGFLDSYASQGLAAATDPSLIILSPTNFTQMEFTEPATEVDFVMMVENWDYPQAGRSISCYVDGGVLDGGDPDGYTLDLEYSFPDVPSGYRRLCCVLVENGEELTNCEATACSQITIWRECFGVTSDPICEDNNPLSAQGCFYDSALGISRCSYGLVDVDGICLSRYDCECDEDTGWGVCLNNACVNCAVDTDCNDYDPCTIDSCNLTDEDQPFCEHEAILVDGQKCCSSTETEAVDCADSSFCTVDSCMDIDGVTGLGHCENIDPGPPCCDNHGDCQDGDPCTVNVCLGHECREGPTDDPLCCNPAEGDADCENGDPCYNSYCNPDTDQCQWTALTPTEQADYEGGPIFCCDGHPDCMAGGIWGESPDDPATLDYCQDGQCIHLLNPNFCECNEGEGCAHPCLQDTDDCTTDICVLATNDCVHDPISNCCDELSDCDDGNFCTDDACVDGECEHDLKPVSECCNDHLDCDDGNLCNIDACLSHHCHYGPNTELSDCCMTDTDCDDDNNCTTETCQTDIHECIQTLTVPSPEGKECCLTSTQCDDNNASTQDSCLGNQCYHFVVNCTPGDACDDYQACTEDSCGQDGTCDNVWQADCCTSDLACNLSPLMPATPEYACKEGTCNADTNACVFTDITDCCTESADCDNGDPCTTDVCVNKKCKHVGILNCCENADDCDDGNACTLDLCVNEQCSNPADVDGQPGVCCESGGDCADGDICTWDLCLGNVCFHGEETQCCTVDAECADENVCTCDLCIYGVCRHLPPDQASNFPSCTIPGLCCMEDDDCESDNNPCTIDSCVNDICTYALQDPCSLPLPYIQSFNDCNNVQPYQGWLAGNGFHFVEKGATSATGNWFCSTAGPLGADKHQRFNWAPTQTDFESYLVSPALNCLGYDYVTVMYQTEFDYYDDVSPKTDIGLGLYLIDDNAGGPGPDDLDQPVVIDGDTYQEDVDAGWNYVTVPATTNWLKDETFFAWQVAGESSYAMNHMDLDDIRVCPGRPPVFNSPPGPTATIAMSLYDSTTFYFTVEDPDDVTGTALDFEVVDAPAWVGITTIGFYSPSGEYTVRVKAKPVGNPDYLGEHQFILRAKDMSSQEDGEPCLFTDLEISLWVLVEDGYVIWDPVDESGNHSDTFADSLYASIEANDRLVQIVEDITVFESLDNVLGVFTTLGVQGLDYVLTDQADGDQAAIDLLSDYLADGGRVYLEGGNTWGFDTGTDLHSQYYFPVTASAGEPAIYGETFPPGAVEGKHFCWGEDLQTSGSATLAYAVDTLAKKVGSSAIPILGDGTEDHELAIAFESSSFGCRTIAATLPFAALVDAAGTRDTLMGKYIYFFENGYPPCTVHDQCFDSEVCTIDTCAVDGTCANVNEPDCIPCEDDRPCTASSISKACAVSSGICGNLLGTTHDSTDGSQVIQYGVPISSTITVAGTHKIQGINLKLYISHNYRGDLAITLEHAGEIATLKAPDPTDNGKHFYYTYDFGLDSGEMEMFVEDGENGPWELTITDTSSPYNGVLLGWSLFIVSDEETCTGDGDCDDVNACTVDACEIEVGETSGFCSYTADPCDDLDACVYFDYCDPDGVGCVYGDVNCDDDFVCTADSCDPVTGCVNTLVANCTNICTSHADCGYDDYCDLSGGTPGNCTPIPNDLTVYCVDCPKGIEDQGTVSSELTLADTEHYIDQIYVKVKLIHTYQGQLTLSLSNGVVDVTLHEMTGGSADNIWKVYEIADPAHVPEALDALNHFHPDGTWTLSVTDSVAGDVGTLDYWTLYVLHANLLDNGDICDNEDMCSSNFCGNGFCCNGTGTGDCCAVKDNCQDGGAVDYWIDAVCDTAADCQGHRVEPLCLNNECVATDIDDDSACDGLEATPCLDCRPIPICTDDEDQDDATVRCPPTCGNDDTVCKPTCFCDGTVATPTGTCVDLLDLGDACAEESDCGTGLHCENGICCNEGDICCSDWSQCPDQFGAVNPFALSFSGAACGDTPTTCQGTREDKVCQDSACGSILVDDDTDCGADIVHSYCGYYPTVYCDATLDQSPACATTCDTDDDCDANAHCTDNECVGDYNNGHDCFEDDGLGDNECISDHCQNGFCCLTGDCCAVAADCLGMDYDDEPWCEDTNTCQGFRVDALCVGFSCMSTIPVPDDTACDQLINCAPYAYDLCDGTIDQPIAQCPETCETDEDCVSGAHCVEGPPDGLKHCFYDKLDCETCLGDHDCVSGNCGGLAGQGICCAAGADCALGADADFCPASYSSDPVCGDPEHCQGTRVDATAVACACGSVTVDDDTACTSAVTATGVECGCFPHPICDGTIDQNPICATTCTLDGECVEGCTCEGACVSKLSNGEVCDEDADCLSEHCSPDGVCCDLTCDGTCESCGLTWETGTIEIDGDYDGDDDFDALGHRLGTGASGVYYLLTWDDDYFYVAWEGVDLANDKVFIAFDIDKDADATQGASAAWGGATFSGDRRPEYVMVMTGADDIWYAAWDGSGNWGGAQDVCPAVGCWWHYAGHAGNLTNKLRIPRTHLSGVVPDQGFAVWMWANNNAEDTLWSVWPDSNPTGAGTKDLLDAQFMKLGAGQCTKRPYNTDPQAECAGSCQACDGLGACMSALAGTDPSNDCVASDPEECGLTGLCGASGCAYWDTATPCLAPSCTADANGDITTLLGVSLCSGDGSCDLTGTTSCFPHLCITDACKDPCEVNPNCVQELTPGPGYYCNNRALNSLANFDCELKLADALYCDEDSDCQSGHCVEIGDVGQDADVGVCCATACNGHCNSCVTGTCTPYADFTDPDLDCGGCEVCNGASDCRPVDPDTDPLSDPKFFCAQNSLPINDTFWDCGLNGECDGLGACDKWNDGEICHNSQCTGCKIEDLPDYCNSEGMCEYQGPGALCDGGLGCSNTVECYSVCGLDAHCCGGGDEQLCHADGYCDPCVDSTVCPTDGSTCCGGNDCGDVKGLLADVGTLTYLTATEGATDDFEYLGLGTNSPDRVFSFFVDAVPLEYTVTVTGTKDGGAPVDTWVFLRENDCASGTVVASNDDCGGDPAAGSCFTLQLKANTTYFLVIDGNGAATDKGDITITSTFDYFCGNNSCDPGEICGVCADCSPCCGDTVCDVLAGENSCTCVSDCQSGDVNDNACGDECCSDWDCENQCGSDCDMCDNCTFCEPPVGALESVTHLSGDTYTVVGWACDPDHLAAIVSVEIHDDFEGSLNLEGTLATGLSRPDLVGDPSNPCGELVGFSGTITISEEGAHTIKAFGLNVDVTEDGAWLDGEICQGVCGTRICGDDGCGVSCGVCIPECQADGDGTFSGKTDACTLGQCVDFAACGSAYACDGAAAKDDGDACAVACENDDDNYCAVGYTCEGVACVPILGTGESCDEDTDCESDNCRKEINSANYYCAAVGRECSDQGADGYDAGGVEAAWICTDVDVSVECADATRCDTWFGRYCDNDNAWTVGDGTSYTCAIGEFCLFDVHYSTATCNGDAGAAGECNGPGLITFACSDQTVLGALHCDGLDWTSVGLTYCCNDGGDGIGTAVDPCDGKHTDCIDSRTCVVGNGDSCQMVAAGTTCDVSGYCILSEPTWCAQGKANGEECAGDFECASKHCDPDLAGVDRCHATETSCVQDHTGTETVHGAGFCVTDTGFRTCSNAIWSPAVTNCEGCESCLAGACQDDDDNCVQSPWDGCSGTCFKTRSNSGDCVAGVCTTSTAPVAEGTVCDLGVEKAPSAAGYCDAMANCTAGTCAAPLSFRACNAVGTGCSDVGTAGAGGWNAPLGSSISVTEMIIEADVGDLQCQSVVGLGCDDTDHCSGDDWFDGYTCDGTGDCDYDLSDIGCCAHSNCTGTQYCDTDHACKDLPMCAKPISGDLGMEWQSDSEDLFNQCADTGWDACDGPCALLKSNTGFCSGTSAACGTATQTMDLGKVCHNGAMVLPGAASYCDMAVDCTTGACAAQTYYRGCSSSGPACVDADRQVGPIWNVPGGEVISETGYQTGGMCTTDSAALCDVDPHCTGDLYFDGYACDGAGSCGLDPDSAGCCKSTACSASEYCLLTSHTCTDLPVCAKQQGDNGYALQTSSEDLWNDCADAGAWDGCLGACLKTKSDTGFCSGTSYDCGTLQALVAEGLVCDGGAEVPPSQTSNCSGSIDCVAGDCSASRFYLGCTGTGTTCTQTGKVPAGNWNAPVGTVIDATEYKVGASCSASADYCQVSNHCSGDDWFGGFACDGLGACLSDFDDKGCCDHADCAANEFCNEGDHLCTSLQLCAKRSSGSYGFDWQAADEDLFNACAASGFDGCAGPCTKSASNTGFCSGSGATCGESTELVSLDGKVCVGTGIEVSPSLTVHCDIQVDCVDDACMADRWYRGCEAGTTTCTTVGMVSAPDWNAGVGQVTNETATNYAASLVDADCATDVTACDDSDHCSGNDWYDGYTCGGGGACDQDLGDLGCCDHSDCAAAEYCNEADHQCTTLALCTKRTSGAFGFELQGSDEDVYNACPDSGFDGCVGICQKTKSNSGLCSGVDESCGTVTQGLDDPGKVCDGGAEVDPSAALSCDITVDCATGSCSVLTYFRGCAALAADDSVCVDDNRQTGPSFLATVGTTISETVYKVGTTCATGSTGYCQLQGHCVGKDWFEGFLCDGAGNCDVNAGDIGCCENVDCGTQQYCDLGTHSCTALPLCTQQHSTQAWGYENQADGDDLWDECTAGAWDFCTGPCIKRATGGNTCNGSGDCYPYEYGYLAAGKVCDTGSEVAPSDAINCTTSYDCVDNACAAPRYFLGCAAGATTCVETGKVLGATDWFAPAGSVISTTEYKVGGTCQTADDFCGVTDHCSGDDWFDGFTCDGSGACLADKDDLGCCDHSDCDADEFCNEADHLCTEMPTCTKRSAGAYGTLFQTAAEDLRNECDPSGWDSCNGVCEKVMTNTGLCVGDAAACGSGATPVTAGKVCGAGNEVNPAGTIFCDVAVDCSAGACSGGMWYRGCSADGATCDDTTKVAAGTWYAGAGVVINEDATHSATTTATLTCATADIYCDNIAHCSGNDWFDGHSCDGLGACAQDKGDAGCCNHTDCDAAEYCAVGTHLCTELPLCTKRSGSAFGYDWQTATEDLRNECEASGWDGCIGNCQKTKSNTGFCVGNGPLCGNEVSFLSEAGKVCDDGEEVDPSLTVRCDVAIDCVDNACVAATWYRGCQAGGTGCVDGNHQAGPTWFTPAGAVIDGTLSKVGTSCSTNTDLCNTVGHCVGMDWYQGKVCNGAGVCAQSQNDIGCCSSLDCADAHTYCDVTTHVCTVLPVCTERHDTEVYGYQSQAEGDDLYNECTPGGFDACVSPCVKKATSGSACDGNGACGYDLEYVAEGKVCDGGAEVTPSAAAYCDMTINCVAGACSADRHYRGCVADSDSCSNNTPIAAPTWTAPAGTVVSSSANDNVGACQTSASLYCDATPHCSGDDWFLGRTCDGAGTCDVDKDDDGCCEDSDCSAGEYCNLGDHSCTGLVAPTILAVTPLDSLLLNSDLGRITVTWSGTLPGGYQYNLEEVTPSGGQAYAGASTAYTTPVVLANVLYCYRLQIEDTATQVHHSDWTDTACAFTLDRTPTFPVLASHVSQENANNRVDTSFVAQDSGLVVYMPFEEGSGGSTVDRVTGTAQAISGAGWTTGQMGGALEFDGVSNDMVEMPDTGAMANFTLSTWIYNGSGGDDSHSILGNYWEMHGTELCFYSFSFANTYWRCSGAGTVPQDAWSYVTTTWDGSVIRHYVDGELVWTDGTPSSGSSQSLTQVAGFSSRRMKGALDELRIYNRTLDSREIRDDMIGGVIKHTLSRADALAGGYLPKYSAQSCADLGWAGGGTADVCAQTNLPGCYPATTWSEAKVICEGAGGRLCTWTELNANETDGTGCAYEAARVWTSSQCAAGSYWTQAGSTANLGTYPKQCTAVGSTVAVRCCADAAPGLATNSLQDTEARDWNPPVTPTAPQVQKLSDTEITVQWSSPADQGVTYYFTTGTVDAAGNESNIITHPSFEDATDHSVGSSGSYSFVSGAGDAHSGTYGLKAVGGAFEYRLELDPSLFEVGGTYRLSAWAKEATTVVGCDQYLYAQWYFSGGPSMNTSGGDVIADGAWHEASTTVTLPTDRGAITSVIWHLGFSTCTGERWMDDLKIQRVTSATITTGTSEFEVEVEETDTGTTAVHYGWGSALSHPDTGLTGETEYCYRVRAKDDGGNVSSWSGQACDTTDPTCVPLGSVIGTVNGAASGQVCEGGTVNLAATAGGGACTGQTQFQWFVQGEAVPIMDWASNSHHTPTVDEDTTYVVHARCNDCAFPEPTPDTVTVTLYECCDHGDCDQGNYCLDHECTPCQPSHCATIENCRDGTAGCCDEDSDCDVAHGFGPLWYCDDGDNVGDGPFACEEGIPLTRGTMSTTNYLTTTVDDIGWRSNFSVDADRACMMYDALNVTSGDFDVYSSKALAEGGVGAGGAWRRYQIVDLVGKVTAGNSMVEFDAKVCCHEYDNVMFGWLQTEQGAVDTSGSTSCCNAATDCVDDHDNTANWGCFDQGTWRNTGGGHGADTERCLGGVWYTPDAHKATCQAQGGWTWFSATTGTATYGPCCGDDSGADDFYYNSQAGNASATTLDCRRCDDGVHVFTPGLKGNGYADGTTCYYGPITCNKDTALSGATCTMTSSSSKCVAATNATDGCGTPGLWTGGANTTNWFTAGNWDDHVVPGNGTGVTIPTGKSYYPNVNTSTAHALYIVVETGATLTVSAGTLQTHGAHTENAAESIRVQGTLNASGGTLAMDEGIYNRGGTVNFSGATVNLNDNLYNVSGYAANVIHLTAGTVNAKEILNEAGRIETDGGTLNIAGSYRETSGGGRFQGDSGTVNMNGTTALRIYQASSFFPVVNIAGGGTTSIETSSTADFSVHGDLTINGTFNANGEPVDIQADWILNSVFNHGNGTVTFSGDTLRQIRGSASTTFYNLVIAGSKVSSQRVETGSGTNNGTNLTVANNLTVNGYFNVHGSSSGTRTLDVNGSVTIGSGATLQATDTANPVYITVAGNWTNSGGTLSAGTSTRNYFDSGTTATLSGNTAFHDLYIEVPGKHVNFAGGSTTTVAGKFRIGGVDGNHVVLGSTNTTAWLLKNIGSGATNDVDYCQVSRSDASGGITIDARTGGLDMGANNNWLFNSNGDPCVTDADCPDNNCDYDWYGIVKRCHATATKCVNDESADETANNGYWQCVDTGASSETASTKVCSAGTWVAQTCLSSHYCVAATGQCAECTVFTHCYNFDSCQDGVTGDGVVGGFNTGTGNGVCCDEDSECGANSICVNEAVAASASSCQNTNMCRAVENLAIGTVKTTNYSGGYFTPAQGFDQTNCGDHAYKVTGYTSGDLCVRYSVMGNPVNSQGLGLTWNHGAAALRSNQATSWRHNVIENLTNAIGFSQFEVNKWDTGFGNVMFGYYRAETGAKDTTPSTGCCGASTDCVDDSVQNTTSTSSYGCFSAGTCRDTGSSASSMGDGEEYCHNGSWLDQDDSEDACDECIDGTCEPLTGSTSTIVEKWSIGGDNGCGTECCGDDPNEYLNYRISFPEDDGTENPASNPDWGKTSSVYGGDPDNNFTTERIFVVNWANDTSDRACCRVNTDCVYDSRCVPTGQIVWVKPSGADHIVKCVSGEWKDLDGSQTDCEAAGLEWQLPNGAGVGEYDSNADGGYPTGANYECCGDDANEWRNDAFTTCLSSYEYQNVDVP